MQKKNTANEEISVEMERFKVNHSAELVEHGETSTERTTYTGPIMGPMRKRAPGGSGRSAQFNLPDPKSSKAPVEDDDDAYVEVTLDVRDDDVAVLSVKTADGGDREDPKATLLARNLENNASTMIKQVSHELKRLASLSTRSGLGRIDRHKSAAAHALKGLKFISKTGGADGWSEVYERFYVLTRKKGGLLDKSEFGICIGMERSNKFAGELFDALARRSHITASSINESELREFYDQISDQSFDSRLQIFFDMVDKNADGRINEDEVKEIISLCASANRLSISQEQAEEYAKLIMEELDPDNLGRIEVYDLETLLLQAPSQSMNIDTGTSNSRKLSQMLSAKLKPTEERNPIKRWYQDAKYFFQDNWKRIWVILLWLSICTGLFIWKFMQYKNRAVYHIMGYCVCVAKGGAETLKFNMALILLPVCRNTITWLRNNTKLGVVVPFDDNLNFHKVIAIGIAVGVGLHAISHLTCDFPRLLHASDAAYESMKPFFGDTRPNDYMWFVKGTEGWTGIVMVVLMTIAFVIAILTFRKKEPSKKKKPNARGSHTIADSEKVDNVHSDKYPSWFRRGHKNLLELLKKLTGFNAFWYSHHLFVIVYILLIIHGIFLYLSHKWYKKTTWMYLAVPLLLYGTERLIRALRSSIGRVKILKVAVYHSNPGKEYCPVKKGDKKGDKGVLTLHFSKPDGFKYRSGQYIFVYCAKVSPFEWHPFSITSAPQDDYVSVHIRDDGDWTGRLIKRFSKELLKGIDGGNISPIYPKVQIDGPYGAPAQDYKKYGVVLLVGQGIGATPFISILKDIINNTKQLDSNAIESGANGNGNGNSHNGNRSTFKTRRAYFYWVTPEQGSFEWFKEVMNEVAENDKKGVIELHNHCTSVYEEGDARSTLIAMLQSLNHAKNGVDVVSRTRVKSHFARPNWRAVYKRIALNHIGGRVGVFFCGAAEVAVDLKYHAQEFSRKTNTKFDFHKEKF